MPESEAKKAWMKKNTTVVSVKFNHNTESDLLRYLEGKPAATIFKLALREYIKNHSEEDLQ